MTLKHKGIFTTMSKTLPTLTPGGAVTLSDIMLTRQGADVEDTRVTYTQVRDALFGASSTTDLSEGTNLYYTQARFDTAFGLKSTTDLIEGTNLYYTEGRVSANVDVAANTAARHAAATVSDSSTIDFTITGQDITGSTIDGAINHNALLNYVANEHIDWTNATNDFLTTGTATISDDLTVNTDTFHVDTTLERVGINDLTPGAKLEVRGNAGGDRIFQISGESSNTISANLSPTLNVPAAAGSHQFWRQVPSVQPTGNIGGFINFNTNTRFDNSAFDVTTGLAFASQIELRAGYSGTMTNAIAIRANSAIATGGTITNAYGLFLQNQNVGTNNFSIYGEGGDVILNANGTDSDTRIEGSSMSHMFFMEGDAASENIALLASSLPNWQSMDRGVFIGNVTTAPTGNPSGGGFLYVTGGALTYRGSSGTVTTLGAA